MKKFFIIWIVSSIGLYLFGTLLYFLYNKELFPALLSIELICLLSSILCLFLSAIAFHPIYYKILNINKKLFYLEFVLRYLFFVALIFAKFFEQKVTLYIAISFCIIIETLSKFVVFRIYKKLGEKELIADYNDIKISFFKAVKEKAVRNITQVLTIVSFILLIKFGKNIDSWILCVIGLLILPSTWALAEWVDVKIINKEKNK